MLGRIAHFFDKFMRRYTPDPFLFAIFLTFFVFLLGIFAMGAPVDNMILYWGKGFWALIPFTLQMVMILVTGYVVATSKPVRSLLSAIATRVKTPGQAIIITSVIAALGCWLNWGFGLVIGAFVCRTMKRCVPTVNYRVLVASAYSGFLVWHGGFSGSVPLLLATPGNFSEPLIGRVIPLAETLGMPLNLCAVIGLIILLPLTNYFMGKNSDITPLDLDLNEETDEKKYTPTTPAEKWEHSPVISWAVTLLGVAYLYLSARAGSFHLNLNTVNFIFLMLGILLHARPRRFLHATGDGAKKVAPILIQYPFYAGIMGMMQDSGLAASISNIFVAISNETTFPLFTFYSAGIVNFFIPSGGGQWAVQSPIVLPAATQIGTNLAKAAMAVAWGDAWTNMAQPFWALPLLAIAGLKIRDIMGYCITILIVSGLWLSLLFLVM